MGLWGPLPAGQIFWDHFCRLPDNTPQHTCLRGEPTLPPGTRGYEGKLTERPSGRPGADLGAGGDGDSGSPIFLAGCPVPWDRSLGTVATTSHCLVTEPSPELEQADSRGHFPFVPGWGASGWGAWRQARLIPWPQNCKEMAGPGRAVGPGAQEGARHQGLWPSVSPRPRVSSPPPQPTL